jgi:hypothetical protein
MVKRERLDWINTAQVAGSCERDDEPSSSIKGGEYIG